MLKFELPCSVKAIDRDPVNGDQGRVKFNVDPGSTGEQMVIMHAADETYAFFKKGRRYVVTFEEVDE